MSVESKLSMGSQLLYSHCICSLTNTQVDVEPDQAQINVVGQNSASSKQDSSS